MLYYVSDWGSGGNRRLNTYYCSNDKMYKDFEISKKVLAGNCFLDIGLNSIESPLSLIPGDPPVSFYKSAMTSNPLNPGGLPCK